MEELAAAKRLRLETGEDQSPLPVEVLSELGQVPYRELEVEDSYDGRLIQLTFLVIGDIQLTDTLDVLFGGEPAVEPDDGADWEKYSENSILEEGGRVTPVDAAKRFCKHGSHF